MAVKRLALNMYITKGCFAEDVHLIFYAGCNILYWNADTTATLCLCKGCVNEKHALKDTFSSQSMLI